MAERKITSEQIIELVRAADPLDPRNRKMFAVRDLLEEWYPEEFRPTQKYCCDWFRENVEHEHIKRNPCKAWFTNIRAINDWLYVEVKYCLNCGQKPRPPIKEKL